LSTGALIGVWKFCAADFQSLEVFSVETSNVWKFLGTSVLLKAAPGNGGRRRDQVAAGSGALSWKRTEMILEMPRSSMVTP